MIILIASLTVQFIKSGVPIKDRLKRKDQNSTKPLEDTAWTITEDIFGNQAEYGIHPCFKVSEIIGLVLMGLVLSNRRSKLSRR